MESNCWPSDVNKSTTKVVNLSLSVKMRVNPVLEKHGLGKPGIWDVVCPYNKGPCTKVVHTRCCDVKFPIALPASNGPWRCCR